MEKWHGADDRANRGPIETDAYKEAIKKYEASRIPIQEHEEYKKLDEMVELAIDDYYRELPCKSINAEEIRLERICIWTYKQMTYIMSIDKEIASNVVELPDMYNSIMDYYTNYSSGTLQTKVDILETLSRVAYLEKKQLYIIEDDIV